MVSAVPDRLAHVDQEDREPLGPCARAWSFGVVRASSSIKSECSARLVQTFWPLTTIFGRRRAGGGRQIDSVSVPLVGSVTPKACSRSAPDAI